MVGGMVGSALIAALVTAVLLTSISIAATPIGWVLTALAAALGSVLPYAAHRLRARGTHRLAVWHLPPQLAQPVVSAAEQARRLRQLAQRSPDGAVSEHFERLAHTAEGYVIALHDAAVQAHAISGDRPHAPLDPDLEADMNRLAGELTELVEAADALRQTQRRLLEHSPLAELTNETENLRRALEAQHSDEDGEGDAPVDPALGAGPDNRRDRPRPDDPD